MSTRHVFAMIVLFCTLSQVGCVCTRNGGCGMGASGGPSCGVADACAGGCDECPSCGVADVSCGCPDGCGSAVRGPTPVVVECKILSRIRNAICGCTGCGDKPYYGDWLESPASSCESCDNYGNHTGGPYGSRHGRRAQMAKRNFNFDEELRLSEAGATSYR